MKILICTCLLLLSVAAQSQMKSFGFQLGYGSSKLNIQENETNFKEFDALNAYYMGIYYRKSPSRTQSSKKNFPKPGIAFELGASKSGGNFLLERRNRNGKFYEQFIYLNYRMELGVMGELHYSGFKLLIGPQLYYPLYNTRKREKEDNAEYNLKEYEDATLALVVGLGYEYSIFSLDLRYKNTLTDYGQRYKDIPFEFSERQWRLTAGIRIFKTNRERNNDSIFWE